MSSRVVHIVLLKVKESTPQDKIVAMMTALRNMKEPMSHLIQKVTVGKNFTSRGKGYTHALVVEIAGGPEGLKEYAEHPVHVAVKNEHILPIVDDTLAMDYTI